MKTSKLFLAITAIMIAFGCAKIETPNTSTIPRNDKGEYAIVFNNSSVVTKATVTTTAGNGYNEFSLYAWNSSNDTIMNPFRVAAIGAGSYDYEGVDGQKLQYFKNNAGSYSFIGVIPTTDVKVKNGAVKVGVESFVVDDNRVSGTLTADSPKEFLWARADVKKVNYGQTVTLPFKHGNALLYLGFISNDDNTQIVDYTPHVDAQPGTAGTPDEKTSKMFDELAAGNTVGWPYAKGTEQSTYSGSSGSYMCYQGSNESTARITNARLAKLMPLVNAQFIYTDKDGNDVSSVNWVKGTEKKNTVYLKFADSVNTSDFLAGNDAFWTNLTADEKTAMQNWYDSGVRIARINQISDGNYFVWGMMNTSMTITVITGATPAVRESGFKGIRVFSAQTDATDGYAHLPHTKAADATVSTGLTFDNRVTVKDSIQFSLPTGNIPVYTGNDKDVAAQAAVYSPTTFYAIPGDAGLTHFVVKLSYTYNGTIVYDVRVPIKLPTAGLEAGKYYKYIIKITSTANGTNDPDEANKEKDDIDITNNPIRVTVDVTDYGKGHIEIITI